MTWCFSTRASGAAVLTTHPCVSLCLRVNSRKSCIKWPLNFAVSQDRWSFMTAGNKDDFLKTWASQLTKFTNPTMHLSQVMSHNAPFSAEKCTFLFCEWCIVGLIGLWRGVRIDLLKLTWDRHIVGFVTLWVWSVDRICILFAWLTQSH